MADISPFPTLTQPLSRDDYKLIIDALWAVTRTGGGSPQYHLAARLQREIGVEEPRYSQVERFQHIAREELNEAEGA